MDVGCTGMQEIVHAFQKDMQGGRDIRKYWDSVRLWAGTFDMQKTVPVIWKIMFCVYCSQQSRHKAKPVFTSQHIPQYGNWLLVKNID